MEATRFDRRSESENAAPLVISRTDEGYRIYSVANPRKSYLVSGSAQAPVCTCAEFQNGSGKTRCRHIEAVLDRYHRGEGETDQQAREERLAIQEEGRVTPDEKRHAGPAVMLLKRSVSPDGRIDALSVEFSTEVDGLIANEVVDHAARLLALQTAIVKGFLEGAKNGDGTKSKAEPDQDAAGAVLAEMMGIGGMDGRWGRRLFISFQADGQSLRLYGNKNQLAETIRQAGFPQLAERIAEGVVLRAPCRVITKPSPDGRYVNIERVLPLSPPEHHGSLRR